MAAATANGAARVVSARPASARYFFAVATWGVCAAYFLLQCAYVLRLPLVMDEFAGAYQVHMLREGVPYRDYLPYKTVLGYYLQLPFLLLSPDPWRAMLSVKLGMAAATAVSCGWLAQRLRRRFADSAVLFGLVMLLSHSTFAERASELRVDTLTSLFGWFGLVLLLEGRLLSCGVCAGLSVLVSQKGAFFVVSTLVALSAEYAANPASWRRPFATRLWPWWRGCVRFGVPVALLLLGYWLVFGVLGGFERVFGRVASSPTQIAFAELYELRHFWWQTLERNPVFYAVAAASALTLLGLRLAKGSRRDRDLLSAYAFALTALCIWHKQPWPYFFVLLLPTLAVVVMAGLSAWCAGIVLRLEGRGSPRLAPWLLGCAASGLLLGCVWLPLRRIPTVLERDQSYQRRTLAAAYALAGDGQARYFAGTQLLWRLPHVPGTSWLDQRRLAQIERDPELALAPLNAMPPKLVVFTYRFRHLPSAVRRWFAERYEPVGGSLLAVRVAIQEGEHAVVVEHGGTYKLLGPQPVHLDGQSTNPGDVVELASGRHRVESRHQAAFIAWSDEPAFLEYTSSPPERFFYNLYRY